jgi:hypothetical protein
MRRFGMWLFVCLLVCTTVALAVEAKRSQYHSQTETSSYLSKATKMSEGRAPQLGLVEPLPQIAGQLADMPVAWMQRPPEPTHPKLIVFLDSFQFRPPPPRI